VPALERKFENRAEFVIDDDHPAAWRQNCQRLSRLDLPGASRGFLCCLLKIGELNAFVVEEGHPTASNMEEVAIHREHLARRERRYGTPLSAGGVLTRGSRGRLVALEPPPPTYAGHTDHPIEDMVR
jgi:hypothetical protein